MNVAVRLCLSAVLSVGAFGCSSASSPQGSTDAGETSATDAGSTADAVSPVVDAGGQDARSGDDDAEADVVVIDSSGGSPLTATVQGWGFADARSAHSAIGALTVDITEGDATCAAVSYPHNYAAGTRLLHLSYVGSADPATVAQTIGQPVGGTVSAEYITHDSTCGVTAKSADDGGTVTFLSVKPDRVVGTFDVTIGQASFKGTFESPLCGANDDAGAPACP